MSYTKQTWQTGDTITAEKLNHIEDGVDDLTRQLSVLEPTATSGDVGKALVVKTVSNGKATSYKYGNAGGLTNDQKLAILNCFAHVAWTDDQGQDYYDELEAALDPLIVYTVTNTLVGCTSSNNDTDIVSGESYTATITASAGYTLTGATVNITMGSTDITNTAYSNGTISIASVTGNLVITITAAESQAVITSITASFSGTAYENEIASAVESGVTVTAHYSDSSSAAIVGYTITGTAVLSLGDNTFTIAYDELSTTLTISAVAGNKSDQTMWTSGVAYTDIDVIEGSYYNRSYGTIVDDDQYSRIMIPCHGAARIDYTATLPSNAHYNNWFYDADKQPLSTSSSGGFTMRNKHSISVPQGAYYVGMSDYTEGYFNLLMAGTITPYDTAAS